MNGLANAPFSRSLPEGGIRIDVEAVLGRLRAVAGDGALDRYLVACTAVQFWADLLAACQPAGTTPQELQTALQSAESAADHAARTLLGQPAQPITGEDIAVVHVELSGHTTPSSLSKFLHLPMPECCGYDLADLELITSDGEQLIEKVGNGRPVLVVGIRTGGTYLAPLWKAVMARLGVADAHWCTVRPHPENGTLDGLTNALAWLQRRCVPVVVVVDDQPDTGGTMERVAAPLRAGGVELWFSSVGRLWRCAETRRTPVRLSASLANRHRERRLWECLLAGEHRSFVDRLGSVQGLPALPEHAQLKFRCPHGEACYGHGRIWLPWNHAQVLNGRRPLVNPHKTPLSICGPEGRALLHLRFIGEGVFGRAEAQRAQDMCPTRPVWFVDGYTVTCDIGDAWPFQEFFHSASPSVRADLLAQTAGWLTALAQPVSAYTDNSPMAMRLGPRWSAIAREMRERCGPLAAVARPLGEFLERPVPWLGWTGRAIRSSLRYACGGWHWQVGPQARLHRFQLEANWGDLSFPELELAAFALENRLSLADTQQLSSLCQLPYWSVRESLPLAALTIAEARVRSARTLSDAGRSALRHDFYQLLSTTSDLAELRAT